VDEDDMFKPKQVHFGPGLFFIVTLAAYAETSDRTTTKTCAKISVQVANAGVPSATLARAQAETSRIFREAGIEIEWQTYRVSKSLPGCPVRLIVSILPHATAFASGQALGSTGSVVHSLVFWDRIEELAQMSGSTDVILGHAMAHEIGHMLLGPASHSSWGIMRPKWSAKDIKAGARGLLNFTHEQAEGLRLELIKRSSDNSATAAWRTLRSMTCRRKARSSMEDIDVGLVAVSYVGVVES
jgi:hypothetical protein